MVVWDESRKTKEKASPPSHAGPAALQSNTTALGRLRPRCRQHAQTAAWLHNKQLAVNTLLVHLSVAISPRQSFKANLSDSVSSSSLRDRPTGTVHICFCTNLTQISWLMTLLPPLCLLTNLSQSVGGLVGSHLLSDQRVSVWFITKPVQYFPSILIHSTAARCRGQRTGPISSPRLGALMLSSHKRTRPKRSGDHIKAAEVKQGITTNTASSREGGPGE